MDNVKNAILITLDSLRADHLGCMGYHKNTSPHIDHMARHGILFTRAIANSSYTKSAFPAILTSTYPFHMGGYYTIKERTSIAEVLKDRGYATAAFPNIPWLSSKYGYDKGFDTFEEVLENRSVTIRMRARSLKNRIIKKLNLLNRIYSLMHSFFFFKKHYLLADTVAPYTRADDVNRWLLDWVQSYLNENFFVWIHYMDTHHPYNPPRGISEQVATYTLAPHEVELLNHKLSSKIWNSQVILTKDELRKLVDLYDREIRYVDNAIGFLVSKLEKLNILKDTLIFITSDHGEEFLEHGALGHVGIDFRTQLYDELLHIPLIVSHPEIRGKTIKSQVAQLDIAPTILDFLGFRKVRGFQGNSLLPLLKGEIDKVRPVISEASAFNKYKGKLPIPENEKRIASIRTEEWKYIYNEEGSCELYDLRNDSKEKRNLVRKQLDVSEQLKSILINHIQNQKREWLKYKIKRVKEKTELRTRI